jgi:hypothetical protein
MQQVSDSQAKISETTKQNTASTKDFAVGMSGVATAGFGLYSAYDRVHESEVALDRSNLVLQTSTNGVEKAENALQAAQAKGDPVAIKQATDNLDLARQRLQVSTERQQLAEDNVNKSMMSAALQVIPSTITMVDSLSRAWNNFPDVSALLTKISAGVAGVGISAKTAAIGVAAFMGGFLIADTILGAIPENMRQIAGALTASIAAIVAATIAWMAFEGTMTMGVAVPIILAAVGVGIAGVKAAVAMAEGGVTQGPTYALIGEAGQEIVMPLDRYEAQRAADRQQTVASSTQQPGIAYVTVNQHFYGDVNSPEYIDQAAEATTEKMTDKLAHWR